MKDSDCVKVTLRPSGATIAATRGKSLLEILTGKGIGIPAICGGKGKCGKCKVRISEAQASVMPTFLECSLLSDREIGLGYRLACQFIVNEDVEVQVSSDNKAESSQSSRLSLELGPSILPAVRKESLSVPKPSVEDQRSDLRRLTDGITVENGRIRRLELLKRLPSFLRENDFTGTVTLYENEIIDLRSKTDNSHILGVAIDIGTTTIAMYLLDLENAIVLDSRSIPNPQSVYGQDVISRIDYAASPNGLTNLKNAIVEGLAKLSRDIISDANVSSEQVYDVSVVGNTTMIHLLLGISPQGIALSPFIPVTAEEMIFEPFEVHLQESFPNAKIYIMQGISAYVGSDLVAGIIRINLENEKGNALLVDLGTNGEIILKSDSGMLAASTAAGPAFEGGHISNGMIAKRGAIDHVWIDGKGKISFSTILNSVTTGICGSGLLDTVAVLLEKGILASSGKLSEDPFVLHNELGAVTITQKDIREVQLAKSAIRAGIEVLLSEAGITYEELDRIFLAGAFGSFVNVSSAVRIGLLPDISTDRILSAGNAAGEGACICLLDRKARDLARALSNKISYVELSGCKRFSEYFINFMTFPKEANS